MVMASMTLESSLVTHELAMFITYAHLNN